MMDGAYSLGLTGLSLIAEVFLNRDFLEPVLFHVVLHRWFLGTVLGWVALSFSKSYEVVQSILLMDGVRMWHWIRQISDPPGPTCLDEMYPQIIVPEPLAGMEGA